MLRPFAITDYHLLNKYKKQVFFLYNQLVLTQGPAAVLRSAWFPPLAAFNGIFTYLSSSVDGRRPLIGQARHKSSSAVAHCTFLTPEDALGNSQSIELFERMLIRVGKRGAQSLLADVEEGSSAFVALRQAGFSSYARQRVWRYTKASHTSVDSNNWRRAVSSDEISINLLRNSLLPGQVQQLENGGSEKLECYVYYRDNQLLACTELQRGPRGFWLQSFVSLDAENVDLILAGLVAQLHPKPARPLYFSLRSYQDWLEEALQELGALPGPRQVAMSRRTVMPLKVENARRVPVANRRAEPTTPIHALSPAQHREPEWMVYDQTPNYR